MGFCFIFNHKMKIDSAALWFFFFEILWVTLRTCSSYHQSAFRNIVVEVPIQTN